MPHPFRADHIGSLIRPGYLTDVQKAISDGMHMHNLDISKADADLVQRMKDAEKKAISDAVGEQVKRGISPITSGEMERPSFVSGFFESLEGMEIQFKKIADFKTGHPIMRPYLQAGAPGREQPIATGKVKFKRSAYMDELKYVQSLVPADLQKEIKITIPSPSWSHTQLKEGEAYTKDAYADASEYLKDIAEAMRQEILSLYDAGL